MLALCRQAPLEKRIIEDDPSNIYVRVRAREAARYLRNEGVDVSERELTDYLSREFNAVSWRATYGLVMLFRRDREPVRIDDKEKTKVAEGDPVSEAPPALLAVLDVDPRIVDDEDRPLRWEQNGREYFRIRWLLEHGKKNGVHIKWGERAVTSYLIEYYGGAIIRTRHGRAVQLAESNVRFLGVKTCKERAVTYEDDTSGNDILEDRRIGV